MKERRKMKEGRKEDEVRKEDEGRNEDEGRKEDEGLPFALLNELNLKNILNYIIISLKFKLNYFL